MKDTTLPVHDRTKLRALGFRRNGSPIWPVMGGSGEGGSGGGNGDGGDTGNGKNGGDGGNAGGGDGGSGGGGGDNRGGSGDSGRKEFTPINTQEEFDRALGQRLTRERANYANYDEYKAKAEKLDKLEDGQKTEVQRATERANTAEQELATLRYEKLQRQVAEAKGVPLKHAHRLQGKTKEELEADADEYLEDYTPPAGSGGGRRIPGRPKERLRGGGDPDNNEPEETDPRKLAAAIPRH